MTPTFPIINPNYIKPKNQKYVVNQIRRRNSPKYKIQGLTSIELGRNWEDTDSSPGYNTLIQARKAINRSAPNLNLKLKYAYESFRIVERTQIIHYEIAVIS